MKKLLFLLFAAGAFAACNDDDGTSKIRYASENDAISNGRLTGTNMHFYGTSTVTDDKGTTFIDKEARFEFAGDAVDFALYMHKTRFAANMPGVEMRLYTVRYTGTGDNSIAFSAPAIIPEALRENAEGGGSSYQPVARYLITDLEGSIDGVNCRISFTCAGVYNVVYEGKMLVRD